MEVRKTLRSAIVATSAMTAFSYNASWLMEQNYKEPELLAGKLEPALPQQHKGLSGPGGWAAHYSFGIIWSLLLIKFMETMDIKASARNSILIGSAGGITAIACWKILFQTHSSPPKTHRRNFYAQLFLAHLVFTGALVVNQSKA